ncbi:MAG: hypothetical protein IJJ92_09840 [Clostridia bacterium]|nr:hypothetical protein [Clostridia bacterium]
MVTEAWIWILIILVLAIATPLVLDIIREKDYRDQVKGKKKEREWKGGERYEKPPQQDMKYQALKEEAVLKAKNNISGH